MAPSYDTPSLARSDSQEVPFAQSINTMLQTSRSRLIEKQTEVIQTHLVRVADMRKRIKEAMEAYEKSETKRVDTELKILVKLLEERNNIERQERDQIKELQHIIQRTLRELIPVAARRINDMSKWDIQA
ncbi:hypothetical protein EJ06DRAFT_578383 [Trichodelitschia bisporula]|uniref:Uncharacterized protein n=1 Tax=Trichodelitschia bisporula TaxID=703511 RepID=A0A6G1IAD8_9PEZI|nr:hypothetical protein EJ06DRAFT_578383 [Trichodelitschia bisporula]